MGIIHYAVSDATKQAYELGKGAWNKIGPVIDTQDIAPLADAIRDNVMNEGWEPHVAADRAYQEKIAADLITLGMPLRIVNDTNCGDDYLDGYRLVGHRYSRPFTVDEDE